MIKMHLPNNILAKKPNIHPTAFVAKGAQVMGDAEIKAYASIWYNCVVRGDINKIVVGERTNIQDGSILHLENDIPCIIGNDVTVGHTVNLHGCTIEDVCLIGIGAIILSGAVIKKGSIVGAGAVVLENTIIEENSMVVGTPAKVIKKNPPDTYENLKKWANKYVDLAQLHKDKFK